MSLEPELQFLIDLDPEAARWRRRTMYLLSVILHGFLVLFVLFAPNIFRRGAQMMGMTVQPQKRETTYLWLPPDLLKRLKEPPETSNLSEKNRRAQGRSPVIDPNGLRAPYSRGNTPLPEIAGGAPPPQPAAAPTPPPASPVPPAPKKAEEESRLHLMDVPGQPAEGGESRLRLPASTPGKAIQQSLEDAVRGRAEGLEAGPGDARSQFENIHPAFSTEAPIILSDTRGVDFGPYLSRVIFNVRRNWYAVIPESARLGEKGRVAIVFEIVKDGSVPQLRLAASSGADPLDRAALASIRASNPFPPLPEEFTGDHLVLEFFFLYNLGLEPGP